MTYADVRARTEALASSLTPEDQTIQSMADVSPTKWHRAHTTWFFETFVLAPHVAGYELFDPAYAYLFNSYYEAVGPRHARPQRGLLSRPSVADVARYRTYVDDAMASVVAEASEHVAALVELGIHHEQQHQELLLMDIKHVFSVNPLEPLYGESGPHPQPVAGAPGWVAVEAGIAAIGHGGDGFAFDNESPRHDVLLTGAEVAGAPVSCADWLAFVDDGGYRRPELWLSDGWATVQAEGWSAPLYWRNEGGGWTTFTLAGRRPVDPAEPVCHVSYFEADAFARWSGCRLPTEAEWEVASGSLAGTGEVWEWTASPYVAYPGFRPAPGAVGEYNGKFMVNQHVLRGGACVTPPGHARPTYRNFFPPSARWPFCGLRLARDA